VRAHKVLQTFTELSYYSGVRILYFSFTYVLVIVYFFSVVPKIVKSLLTVSYSLEYSVPVVFCASVNSLKC
jgi:hypothetical protein